MEILLSEDICNRNDYGVYTIVCSLIICAGLYTVVTMQAQREMPHDMQSRDKFLIQSVLAPYGATTKDIAPEIVSIFSFL